MGSSANSVGQGHRSGQPDPMNATQPPNNLGPTLLLAIGLLSSPLMVGVPLVIVALAAV